MFCQIDDWNESLRRQVEAFVVVVVKRASRSGCFIGEGDNRLIGSNYYTTGHILRGKWLGWVEHRRSG